ncbi:hypothetical protein N0V94_000229 [Neodidymelliopsis sp. IMI 364377]|nr:hypothetical protein N0V94_000229 [Neodidymelliopsis sp. IMI 364377]
MIQLQLSAVTMAKIKQNPAGTKRPRAPKVHEDKGKVQALLGFDTEKAFDSWRESDLVKPWWDVYVAGSGDRSQAAGKKLMDVENLIHRIREGERLGKRRYLSAHKDPQYDNPEDFHAWLVYWLTAENTTDRNGCFWTKSQDEHTRYSAMHKFVLWARRQAHRDTLAAGAKKNKKAKKDPPEDPEPELEESTSEPEEEELNPEKGTAIVRWIRGLPDELEESGDDRITVNSLCSYWMLSFWQAVDEGFDLPGRMQRRTFLGAKDNSSFREVQHAANADTSGKKFFFHLHTEPATIPEESQAAPETSLPTPEGDAIRESLYNTMVDEAVSAGAQRFDMNVRLWRYNLMLATARQGDRVDIQSITLDLADRSSQAGEAVEAAVQAIQLHDITEEEIRKYNSMNEWIDNPAYQPQNHIEACKNLGIANPDIPHMEGLLRSIVLDRHQPTAINALVKFEDSCVGGALNAEEVGLGKTVETIGLLLFRSNQRKQALARGESVSKALPTLTVLPQNLIQQWKDEIFQFTDRFTVVIYYGPPRKPSDSQVAYIPKTESKGRLTRSHRLFNGAEENSDTIVLTSYSTYTVRHGQWNWLVEEQKKTLRDDGYAKPTKSQAEKALLDAGIVYKSVHKGCPHQLSSLFERVILDEGHIIRHQSDDVGFAISSINGRYRHILSGTPTFDGIEEFAGIMRFLQDPELDKEQRLRDMGFTKKQLRDGTHEKHGKITPLESALYWGDTYLLNDADPKAPLKFTAEAMNKYLFDKVYNQGVGYSTEQQGLRLSQVLKKVMIRRTQTSLLNGTPIAKSLPSVQRQIYMCEFTKEEQEHYTYMMQDETTKLFKKGKDEKSVEWSTTAYRQWCLLASWLGFQYLLDYKASKFGEKRKKMNALTILQDVQKGQDRLKVPKDKQIPLKKGTKITDVQALLQFHCTGSPKLRQLLPILAEVVVLRKEKALLWVNNPAQAEWLEHVLTLCGIVVAQLRPDLTQREQDRILRDFNSAEGKIRVLICSYMVSCAGLNLQKQCRTSIEYEPPPNESVRTQELGRVRRRGQPSPWVRHITLLTKDTLNTKQDSEAILKNLPSLMTQLNMEVWGRADDDGRTYRLGEFVLHKGELCPADDPKVKGLNLKALDADELLVQIQMKLLGRTDNITGEALRQQAKIDLLAKKPKVPSAVATEGEQAGEKEMSERKKGKQPMKQEETTPSTKLPFPKRPLWS